MDVKNTLSSSGVYADELTRTTIPRTSVYVVDGYRDILASGVRALEQAITREEALRLYTISSAYTSFRGGRPGLYRGRQAHRLGVLSDDAMTRPRRRIPDIEALIIILGSEVVYERE
jgi:predicted amidohydrolase YtcJ